MDRTERFYTIDRMMRARQGTTLREMMDVMEISRATIRRDLEYMRDRLAAPIVWDSEDRRYRYDEQEDDGDRYSLPGLWFNASEVHALLTMEHLLSSLQPGLLEPHIGPLRDRIRRLLDSGDHPVDEIARRIRVLHMASRRADSEVFGAISHALLRRYRLIIKHLNRRSGEVTERTVSPQRLAHYRDNWYLDAWCHLRNDLRSFAVDGIKGVEAVDKKAEEISEKQLHEHFAESYGIFSGKATKTAKLKFTPQRARWVAGETWHGQQVGTFQPDGSYILEFGYHEDAELVMDILKHGPEVEVLGPPELRKHVAQALQATLGKYQNR